MPRKPKPPFLNGPGIYFMAANDKLLKRPIFSDAGRNNQLSNPMYYDTDGKWPAEVHFQGNRANYHIYVNDKDGRDIFSPQQGNNAGESRRP